jgi:hypothetical protein
MGTSYQSSGPLQDAPRHQLVSQRRHVTEQDGGSLGGFVGVEVGGPLVDWRLVVEVAKQLALRA